MDLHSAEWFLGPVQTWTGPQSLLLGLLPLATKKWRSLDNYVDNFIHTSLAFGWVVLGAGFFGLAPTEAHPPAGSTVF